MKKEKILFLFITLFIFPLETFAKTKTITSDDLESRYDKFTELLKTSNDLISLDDYFLTVNDSQLVFQNSKGAIIADYTQDDDEFRVVSVSKIYAGMSYDDYYLENCDFEMIVIYPILANVVGSVSYEEGLNYMFMSMLTKMLNELEFKVLDENDVIYRIVDDDFDEETFAMKGIKYIKEADFGDYVMEYAEQKYGEESVIDDGTSIGSFNYYIKFIRTSETTGEIRHELVFNKNADFTSLKEYLDSQSDVISNESDTSLTVAANNYESGQKTNESASGTDDKISTVENPSTGVSSSPLIYSLIAIGTLYSFIYMIRKNELFRRL